VFKKIQLRFDNLFPYQPYAHLAILVQNFGNCWSR